MRQICRVLTSLWLGTLAVGWADDAPVAPAPAQPAKAAPAADGATPASAPAATPAEEAQPLSESQDAINARYKRFEKTMNDMVQFLQKTDPGDVLNNLDALGAIPRPVLETNSVLTISALLRTGKWSSILPQTFVKIVGPVPGLRIIPLVQPVLRHGIGLVLPDREPLSPMARGLAELMGGAEVVPAFATLEAGDGR